MIKITYFHDPAHGWYSVPVSELARLGITNEISQYSYISRDGLTAYLEEDCDMTRYVDALTAAGERLAPECPDSYAHDSPIRSLRRYTETHARMAAA